MGNSIFLGLLLLSGYLAFWYLVKKLLSPTGWVQLVTDFRSFHEPSRQVFWPSKLGVGFASYKGIIGVKVVVSVQGLGLQLQSLTFLLSWVAFSPPLLIPWAAIGPLVATKSWWDTTYETTIQNKSGDGVRLRFNDRVIAPNEHLACWGSFFHRKLG